MTKQKTCKYCKEKFTPVKQFQATCFPPKNCSWEYAKLLQAKKQKKDNQVWKKEGLEKLKKKAEWENELQSLINHIARLIDHNQPCIATGATTGKRNGGHRYSVGSNSTIRFNLHNIHIQSEHSNSWKGGDNDRFDLGLIRVYGSDYCDFVRSLNQTPPINLTVETLKDKIIIARLIVKELKELGNTYKPKERTDLRNEYNQRLGIYSESYHYPF